MYLLSRLYDTRTNTCPMAPAAFAAVARLKELDQGKVVGR